MPAPDLLQATGTVREKIAAEVYRVELANGHSAMGRLARNFSEEAITLGGQVVIEFHPYDLSRGRIVAVG